jgi:hypothetical protein
LVVDLQLLDIGLEMWWWLVLQLRMVMMPEALVLFGFALLFPHLPVVHS